MDYFVEQGASDQEVQKIIQNKYGDRARILSRREIKTGGLFGLFQRTQVEISGYCSQRPVVSSTPQANTKEEALRILEQVRTRGNGAPKQDQLDSVLAEIRSLREEVQRNSSQTVAPSAKSEPAGIAELYKVMEENDFSPAYIQSIVDRLRRECPLDLLGDYEATSRQVIPWIAEGIEIFPWRQNAPRPHVVILVGPTGVGKTTTIAKLAAMYGAVADPPQDVRIITVDTYRIGALQQIQKYGEIMNIPVTTVESTDEMEKQIALSSDADFVFVDTIGKSPHDLGRLAEVNNLVRAANGEVHLAVSATTKRSDILEIMRQFEPFNYQSVVVTKLDETATVGGILSALQEKRKSMSFFTDGQSAPQDIGRARRETFLRRLRGMPGSRDAAQDREVAYVLDETGGSDD